MAAPATAGGFDLATAQPVQPTAASSASSAVNQGGFDLSTATPVQAPGATPTSEGTWGANVRNAGLAARALVQGAAGLAGTAADAFPNIENDVVQAGKDIVTGHPGALFPTWLGGSAPTTQPTPLFNTAPPSPSAAPKGSDVLHPGTWAADAGDLADKVGLPRPQTPGEREFSAAVGAIPSAVLMPEAPIAGALMGAAGGAASQAVKEHGGSPLEQDLVGLGVGGLTGVGAGLARAGAGAVASRLAAAPETAAADAATAATPADAIGAAAAAPPTFEHGPAPIAGSAPPVEAKLTKPAQTALETQRASTLAKLGLTGDVRASAISGDRKAAATDFQTSLLDSTPGKKAAAVLDQERAALGSHLDKLIADAGGTNGTDETSLYNRGQAILQPLQDIQDAYNAKIQQLYGAADAKAQGLPVELASTAKTLADRPAFIGTMEGQQLLRGANAYLRQAGMADDAGALTGATVKQAEQFKQYLNQQWTPRTSRLIGALKDSVDDDVAKSAGGDVYAQARAARTLRARVLDDPKGIASILAESGPEGINRTVDLEKIPDKVARMPVDQFDHIVSLLKTNPEAHPAAQTALNEIRSQMLLRLQEQAQKFRNSWNNRGVTAYLNANSAKLARVLRPSELDRLRTLNDAGNILYTDQRYPGAAAQEHNLAMRGLIAAVRHGGGYVGAALSHGAVGDIAGDAAGIAAAKALERRTGASIAMRKLDVNPAIRPEMDKVLSSPKATYWPQGKTTGPYLRMMARLNTRGELLRAAAALHRAGVRENDPNAKEMAAVVARAAQE